MLAPEALRQELRETAARMLSRYSLSNAQGLAKVAAVEHGRGIRQ